MHREDLDRLSGIVLSLYNLARRSGYPSDLVSLHKEAQATHLAYLQAHQGCTDC